MISCLRSLLPSKSVQPSDVVDEPVDGDETQQDTEPEPEKVGHVPTPSGSFELEHGSKPLHTSAVPVPVPVPEATATSQSRKYLQCLWVFVLVLLLISILSIHWFETILETLFWQTI